ncbi:MAG: hypothetical protein ACPGU7_07550 [Gammaproteobacteria bacterium]
MSDSMEIQNRRVLQELDQRVVEINAQHIEARIGVVGKEDFIHLADLIAELRAGYLKRVLEVSRGGEEALDDATRADLERQRGLYQTALDGYLELKHALERGYFSLSI